MKHPLIIRNAAITAAVVAVLLVPFVWLHHERTKGPTPSTMPRFATTPEGVLDQWYWMTSGSDSQPDRAYLESEIARVRGEGVPEEDIAVWIADVFVNLMPHNADALARSESGL